MTGTPAASASIAREILGSGVDLRTGERVGWMLDAYGRATGEVVTPAALRRGHGEFRRLFSRARSPVRAGTGRGTGPVPLMR